MIASLNYFSVAGFSSNVTINRLCNDDIVEIEAIATDVPSNIVKKAKLLKINLKRNNINDIIYLILGPRYQEVMAKEPFKFSMGERKLISTIIEQTMADDQNCEMTIEHDVPPILTPTFVGNLYGQIERDASNGLFKEFVIQHTKPMATNQIETNQQFINILDLENVLKKTFLLKMKLLINEFMSENLNERTFMQQCRTDIEEFGHSANVAINLPENYLQLISEGSEFNVKGSVSCYCKEITKRKSPEISGYFRANTAVKKIFFTNNKSSEDNITSCWSLANGKRHLLSHASKYF